jgi:hypothetical protein
VLSSVSFPPAFLPLPLPELHRVLTNIFHQSSAADMLLYLTKEYQPELDAMEKWNMACYEAHQSARQRPFGLGIAVNLPPKPKLTHSEAELNFVDQMLTRMMSSSPTSLQVTFRLMQLVQFLPLEKCIQLEYRLSQRLCSMLPNPREDSELFTAPKWKRTSFMPQEEVDKLFEEDWDEDNELRIEYPAPKKPVWYI